MNLVFQGTIDTSEGTQIDCVDDSMEVSLMIFNNISNNYTLKISRFEIECGNIETLLYQFELASGDTIRDTTTYKLSTGDYIRLESTQTDTTYYISADIK
jgi:hypothetical protein